jgi:poly(3-hydroxybutyrate) depolymerase
MKKQSRNSIFPRSKNTWVHRAVAAIGLLLITTAVGATQSAANGAAQSQLTVGAGDFEFSDNTGYGVRSIRVYYYRPQALTSESPIVFVMHGVHRDAQRYMREWIPYALQRNFLLLCPEFDAEQFPSQAYQRGNMFDASKNPIPESCWTFSTIERLFDYVRSVSDNKRQGYFIYGHSAGGQFVHRFVLFMPSARYERAIAANPGYFTMPNYSGHAFPYGLRNSGLSESSLRCSFTRDFVLLLGDQDIDPDDPDLRKTGNAEEQGATRFERGQNYFRAAQVEAARLGARLEWRLKTVEGAHHSDAQMIQAAVGIFFAK